MNSSNQFDFIDIAVDSLNKKNEELCGDHVEITQNEYSKIIVLSDGLGSGVKANILSTLTSNIASTMLRLGSNIIEVLETLEKTLPICKVRGLAYSTFTIIQLFHNKDVYIVEFDNPKTVYIRNGELLPLEKNTISFKGKEISKDIIDICNVFSGNEPGDDTTCLVVKIRDIERITLFSGPPKEQSLDKQIVTDLLTSIGKKVVCGGTAANICSREMNKEIITNMEILDRKVPPYAKIEGLDLVTEGVLTINETIQILENFMKPGFDVSVLQRDNGASKLASMIIKECTHLDVLIGNSINPAHQNPFFPDDLNIKWKSTLGLIEAVKKLGKEVNVMKY